MFNFIKKQFIDVIQWPNPDDSLLMWRFPIADEEIQNGASLTVREAQMAMFVDEGVTADVFGPGVTLNTQTLPVLTNLKNWGQAFESPFKSDVYFFNTKQQLARKWGTSQPVTVRDAEFGAVQLRSFGMYSYRISDRPENGTLELTANGKTQTLQKAANSIPAFLKTDKVSSYDYAQKIKVNGQVITLETGDFQAYKQNYSTVAARYAKQKPMTQASCKTSIHTYLPSAKSKAMKQRIAIYPNKAAISIRGSRLTATTAAAV